MSPEQARGETTDHRADLFSLGSTLYAICAGHPPFRAETPLAVLRRVCDDSPRRLREVNPGIPPWLEALIARLMAKDPSERYQTADEAFDVLKKCLAHVQQPLSSPLPAGLGANWKWAAIKKAWKPVAVLASIVCAGAAIALASAWSKRGPGPIASANSSTSAAAVRNESWPASPEADKIELLIGESRQRAAQTENDLLRRETVPAIDPISFRGMSLFNHAQALEREILSNEQARN
jgi:serine/threonine-protein kinase